jgi:hypothetical protein
VTGRDAATGMAEIPSPAPNFELGHNSDIVSFFPTDWDSQDCAKEQCILDRYEELRQGGYKYGDPPGGWLEGPNSNTFANDLLGSCGIRTIFWPRGIPPFSGVKTRAIVIYSPLVFPPYYF